MANDAAGPDIGALLARATAAADSGDWPTVYSVVDYVLQVDSQNPVARALLSRAGEEERSLWLDRKLIEARAAAARQRWTLVQNIARVVVLYYGNASPEDERVTDLRKLLAAAEDQLRAPPARSQRWNDAGRQAGSRRGSESTNPLERRLALYIAIFGGMGALTLLGVISSDLPKQEIVLTALAIIVVVVVVEVLGELYTNRNKGGPGSS